MVQASTPPPVKLSEFLATVVLRVGLPLLIWSVFIQYADQILIEAVQAEMASENGIGPALWLFGSLSLATSLIAPLLSILLVFYAVRAPKAVSALQYFGVHFSWMVKEQLRAAGKMILWGLLFILPGLWKFFEYSMLNFVVLFDPSYQKGEVDALERARQFFYQHWGKIVGLFIGFTLINVFLTTADEYRSFQEHPLSAVLMVTVDLGIFLILQWLLLRLWEKSNAHVQLERS